MRIRELKSTDKNKHLDSASVCGHKDPAAVRELLTKVGDKWSILLLLSLAKLPGSRARFSELERSIPGIPPRVEYELTDLGKSLLRPMQGLVDWVATNWEQVNKARSRFDAK